jgi:hypothetical protein
LSLRPHGEALIVVMSPVRLQMAVFACLECCWENMAAGGNIALSVALEGNEAVVRICRQNGGDVAEDLGAHFSDAKTKQAIQDIVTSLNCRIGCRASEPGFELILPVAR